jgi:hypothetical protein
LQKGRASNDPGKGSKAQKHAPQNIHASGSPMPGCLNRRPDFAQNRANQQVRNEIFLRRRLEIGGARGTACHTISSPHRGFCKRMAGISLPDLTKRRSTLQFAAHQNGRDAK